MAAVDDDPALLRTLTVNLRARGYEVATAGDGRSALQVIAERTPDLVLLDLGLPDIDGISVLTQLRSFAAVPVLVLSARHASDDKVEALDLGADDYVTKPFGMEELLARIRAALRNSPLAGSTPPRVVQAGDLHLDLGNQTAERAGESVHLTPTEWRLVEVLTRHPGQLVRQTDLLREVWGPSITGRPTTCGSTWPICGASSRPSPVGRATSSPNRGSATASWTEVMGLRPWSRLRGVAPGDARRHPVGRAGSFG